ncbi:WD repeat-containing protein 31 [Exaiptasia diaphana]|nr:WD repeat-containing protein 31 [Exaiptasia diaphana]
MGLRKSKPRRNKDQYGDEGLIDVIASHQVSEHEPVHKDAVTCVAAYSDGFCLSGSADRVSCVKWIPQSHEVVQTGEDKMVKVWDTRTLTPAFTFPPKQYFQTCCDCSDDGKYILTCNNGFNRSGCEATLWDLRQKKQVYQYVGHTQTASACIFLPFTEGIAPHPLIATASHDSTLRIWKRETKETVV